MSKDVIAAEAGMLIRRPVAEVFEALIDPDVTRFWFTRSSGKLEAGARVRWEWEMYGHSADVDVDVLEENERIVMRWPAYEGDAETTLEWMFTARPDNTTFVTVTTQASRAIRPRSPGKRSAQPKASRWCWPE
jgi:uncharacterized protein YndB with AHSA1/START domain